MNRSDQIRKARERLGMSQETLAEQVGVSRQAVSKWEMGTASPSLENLQVLSQALGVDLAAESEAEAPKREKKWKLFSLALGCLVLALGAALLRGAAEIPGAAAPKEPTVTATAFFDAGGTPLRPNLGDGWLYFTPGSQVLMAVSYQDGTDSEVHAVSLFLTPAGSETFNERQQLAVQAVEMNRGIALFPLEIPRDLMGHMDITLECGGGQTVTETLNVTSVN